MSLTHSKDDLDIAPDVDVSDSFDFARICVPYTADCDKKAKWLLTKDCGCEIPLCREHKRRAMKEVIFVRGMLKKVVGATITCMICGHISTSLDHVLRRI